MPKLANINLPDATSKKAKSTIKTIAVEGDIVTRFNEARDQIDKATEVIEELKPDLRDAGLEAVFSHNHEHAGDSKALISSVNLTDLKSGEIVQFSWTRKNLKNNAKQVNEEFKHLRTVAGKKADINDYAGYTVLAEFDTKVFNDENGKFSQDRYDAYIKALCEVSEKFRVMCPLSCSKVLKPKADFHDRRWQDFDVETNLAIQTVMPTQVNLEPIRIES